MSIDAWHGPVPPDWTAGRLGYYFDVVLGKGMNAQKLTSGATDAPYLAAGSIQPEHLRLDETRTMPFTEAELANYSLKRGDVVVVEGGAGYGRSHLLAGDLPGWGFQNHVARLRARHNGVDPAYLLYCLKACLNSGYVEANNRTATLPSLSRDVLATISIPLPPHSEQQQIADYLDRETAQIDALIEAQQQLVETLRERRASVVDTTLASGIDPIGVPRPTGDAWIPTLPTGWDVVSTRRLLAYGPSNGVSPEPAGAEGLRSLTLGAIRDGRVMTTETVTKFVDGSKIPNPEAYRLHPDDILLVRGNGNVDLVARAGLAGPEFATQEYIYPDLLMRVRMKPSMLPKFFVWACNASATRGQVRASARTAVGTFKVAAGDVRSLVLPLPPINEQRRIVAYLEEQTARIDALIVEVERFVALSSERRSALITAAVTGQIDVRDRVA